MDTVIKVAAVCVMGSLLALMIRKTQPEHALVLVLAVSTAVFLALGSCLREALAFFEELADRAGLSSELLIPLYKTLGIALVVRIGGGLCRDAGESALSSVLEAAGALCTLLAALPLFRNVLDLLTELMK